LRWIAVVETISTGKMTVQVSVDYYYKSHALLHFISGCPHWYPHRHIQKQSKMANPSSSTIKIMGNMEKANLQEISTIETGLPRDSNSGRTSRTKLFIICNPCKVAMLKHLKSTDLCHKKILKHVHIT
jgi:hypothetical protein